MPPLLSRPFRGLSRRVVGRGRPLHCSYSSLTLSRLDQPFRMAVVGSGPAGFYTAYRVMSLMDRAKVDMYEALPVPFGLVRFGVAPDHPKVKKCQDKFAELAASPNFTFVGNVSIGIPLLQPRGQSVPLETLLRHYDAVLLAYGAPKDRTLSIPGESTLRRIYSAREFVGWYNGLPEFADLDPDLSPTEAVVIGQGNVALDVARLLLSRVDDLRKTDMAEHALEALSRSRVRSVTAVGRRGPMQAAFTIKELRELMDLPGLAFDPPVDPSLVPTDLAALPRPRRRITDLLLRRSKTPPHSASCRWSLDFCLAPTAFHPDATDSSTVATTTFERTSLSLGGPFDPTARPVGTGITTSLPSPLVFRSIGYKSLPLWDFKALGIGFDRTRGAVANDAVGGRVLRQRPPPAVFPGLYCAGWAKRGPTGVIASTMCDAFATAEAIVQDWKAGKEFLADAGRVRANLGTPAGWDGVQADAGLVIPGSVVDWDRWLAIDKAERVMGQVKGKEREKFTRTEDMLKVPFSALA